MSRTSRVAKKEKKAALIRIRDKTVKYANQLIDRDQSGQTLREKKTKKYSLAEIFKSLGNRREGAKIDRAQRRELQGNVDRDLYRLFHIFSASPKASGRITKDSVIITIPAENLNSPKRIQKMTAAFMRREWKKEKRTIQGRMARA